MITRLTVNSQLAFAPYQRHSETSREAAQSIGTKTPALRATVLSFIKTNGPVTDSGIIDGLGLPANSVRPRRIELMQRGEIRQEGTMRQANGRRAALWVITENNYRGEGGSE